MLHSLRTRNTLAVIVLQTLGAVGIGQEDAAKGAADDFQQLQLLLTDPTVAQLDARLGPGLRRGESRLEVDVREARRFTAAVTLSNERSASVGEPFGELELGVRSLLGYVSRRGYVVFGWWRIIVGAAALLALLAGR